MDTRREFLAKAAFLSGAAAATGDFFGCIERTLAIEPEPDSTFMDAEHVVILMQENRSFDHAFGTLRGVRGFNDPRAITLPNGNPVWVQTNRAGDSYAPFRLNIKDSKSTWMGCLPHGWTDQTDARNEGLYNRWLDVKRSSNHNYAEMPLTLGYYNRDDIPFYYALADAFTICDQHFCSSLTGTTPNRCYLWTGTIRAKQDAQSPANVLNSDADHDTNVSWPTFPERLEDLGVSWKVYQNEVSVGVGFSEEEAAWLSNFGDNPLEYFKQFNVRLAPSHRKYLDATMRALPGDIAVLRQQLNSSESSSAKAAKLTKALQDKKDLLRQIATGQSRWTQAEFDKLSPRSKALIEKAFCTNADDPHAHELDEITYRAGEKDRRVQVPKGDLLYQFRKDVNSGKLPTVSWVVPPEHFSDHPGSAWYGAWYISEVLDILTKNPEVWKKTIFILTYDENDGYFDHVPPFVAPDPRRPETGRVSQNIDASLEFVTKEDEMKRKPAHECRDSSIGLGYRVPLIVASPWSRGGYVCSQVFDHTSPLQFLERFLTSKLGHEVRETNISEWRRTVCGDLTSAFQPGANNSGERLPFPSRDAFVEQIHRAQFKKPPSGYKKLTEAEITAIRSAPNSPPGLPRQEPGVRPACALPYELAVDGRLSDDRQAITLTFAAKNDRFKEGAFGSPFVVYAHFGDNDVKTRNFAVAPGDKLVDSWPLKDFPHGHYHLSVYGPNGFYREFHGNADDPRVDVHGSNGGDAGKSGDANVLTIQIRNSDSRPRAITMVDNAYGNPGRQLMLLPSTADRFSLDCASSFGWYDLTIRIDDSETHRKRFAGHVEIGKPSFSDPAMGGVIT